MTKNFIFGIRAVIEAIKAGKEIEKILFKRGLKGELSYELKETAKKQEIPLQYVPQERIDRITRKNHQGVLAFISEVEYSEVEKIIPAIYEKGESPLLLILDKISDVRNVGAIARTAECTGVHAIIIPIKGAALINADAVKTSSGAINNINICRVKSILQTINYLRECGIQIVAASEKAEKKYYNADFSVPTAIIMGAEDKGVSREALDLSDTEIKIPLKGKIKSLNVSVACGVIVFEALKQREANI